MKTINKRIRLGAACALLLAIQLAHTAHAQDAEKLKGNELTPMGSERAGNADGSIPAWDGGMTGGTAYDGKGKRTNPFAGDKPLYSVTAQNMGEYEEVLTAGTKAMLEKYPDTYRIDVYPSRRTFAAPQWFYDNTYANATRGSLGEAPTFIPKDVFGGVPFPLAKNGPEVMWNHLLNWRGYATRQPFTHTLTGADGTHVTTAIADADVQMPYFDPKSDLETFQNKFNGDYWLFRMVNDGPPIRAKEGIVGRENLDPSKTRSWVYLTGQRRVRMLPNSCCDTPTPAAAGVAGFDDLGGWLGRLDRFDWELVGKQEMLIPYNNNAIHEPDNVNAVLGKFHINPDHVRWERHRVYVVKSKLRQGQRHTAPASTYYVDEDSWRVVAGERYDAQDGLWKVLFNLPIVAPELPGFVQGPFGFYDLNAGTWYLSSLENNHENNLTIMEPWPDVYFTPSSLTGSSLR